MSSGISQGSNVTYGTNIPPISFPGIVSGLDYNSIINKLESLTIAPTIQLNQQIATLNAANAELIKIDGLLNAVQSALAGISQPNVFGSYTGTSSNLAALTAQGIPGTPAIPGAYTIQSVQTATSTSVASNPNAGHSIYDTIGGTPSDQVPLIDSYAAVTPSNGTGSSGGQITIDGQQVAYNVGVDSLVTILARIQTAVQTVDPGFTATLLPSGQVQLQSSDKPITLGSGSDSGNLLQVLKLDQAQVINTSGSGIVTGLSNVGGINQAEDFSSVNPASQTVNANFVTSVTAGTFTLNGVSISITTGDSVASTLAKINTSKAGVLATYNAETNQISLTATATGPQSIVVGSGGDTSNFLSAAGLTTGSGATTTIGTQAKIVIQQPGGGTQTTYSNSNTVTTAIPGIQLNLLSNTTTPFTVTVAQDTTQLVNSVTTFVSAYNAVVAEIASATAPPIVLQKTAGGLPGQTGPAPAVGGGVLYGNADARGIEDQLINLVSSVVPGAGSKYNSLSQVGITLDSSITQLIANTGASTSPSGTPPSPITTQTLAGTDGQLQPLNAQALVSAFQADPQDVQALLNGPYGLTQQLGAYLTGVTGLPTLLSSGIVGQIPQTSQLQNYENTITDQISSLQQQVNNITGEANLQADLLRAEFTNTEAQLSQYQALQSQLGSFFKSAGG